MSDLPQSPERRMWLLGTLGGAIGTTLAAILFPMVAFLWPRKVTESGGMSKVAPFRLHQLGQTSENPFDFGGKPCLIVQTPDGDLKAFNAICTHTDCTVQFRPEKGDIFCNCHNGVYDINGRPVSGPPPRELETYKVDLRPVESGEEEIIVSRA